MAHASLTVGARGVTAALAAVLLAACGGSSTDNTTTPAANPSTTSSPTSSPRAASPAAKAPSGSTIAVVETEFSITLPKQTFAPGTYTFTIKNTGKFPHNLIVEGPGIDKQKSPTLTGGKSGTLTVALTKGTYELWCGVDKHKDKGMDQKITVG